LGLGFAVRAHHVCEGCGDQVADHIYRRVGERGGGGGQGRGARRVGREGGAGAGAQRRGLGAVVEQEVIAAPSEVPVAEGLLVGLAAHLARGEGRGSEGWGLG